MFTLNPWAYYSVVVVVVLLMTPHIIALISVVRILFSKEDTWAVDRDDPVSEQGKKGVLRSVEPLEMLVIVFGGDFHFPVIQQGGARFTARGLQEGDLGMNKEKVGDWDIITVGPTDTIESTVQSKWGYVSPIYTFRKLVHLFTRRHVVRIWFPFFLNGFWEMYKPQTTRFVRARNKGTELRTNMELLGQEKENCDREKDSAEVWMVADTSDHVLREFPLRLLSGTMPTKSGYSFRADLTFTIEVINIHRIFRWHDWSSQILTVVSDAVGKYFRSGDLKEVYATEKPEKKVEEMTEEEEEKLSVIERADRKDPGERLQYLIAQHLKDAKAHIFAEEYRMVANEDGTESLQKVPLSVMDGLGLSLRRVTLNDLVPADKKTEDAVTAIMSILPEGRNRASAAGMLLKSQTEALRDVDEVTAQALAGITAAQQVGQAGGKVDYLIGTGQQNITTDQALLNKVAKSLSEPKSTKQGGEK